MDHDIEALEGLLELRERRLREAETTLARAHRGVGTADEVLEGRRRTLHEHRTHRAPREESLFNELAASSGRGAALAGYRHAMNALAHEEVQLRERIVEAERAREAAESALARAREHHAKAAREREKLHLLVEERREEIRCEARQGEEKEAEDWNVASGGASAVSAGVSARVRVSATTGATRGERS